MTRAGATVSVIALGTEKSQDADLLKEIAELGQGRIFFCDRPGDIPDIFTQETISVPGPPFWKNQTPCTARPVEPDCRGTAGLAPDDRRVQPLLPEG